MCAKKKKKMGGGGGGGGEGEIARELGDEKVSQREKYWGEGGRESRRETG